LSSPCATISIGENVAAVVENFLLAASVEERSASGTMQACPLSRAMLDEWPEV